MGLRERIEREVRSALKRAEEQRGGHINRSTRVNAVFVRNVGEGSAAARAEQTAPIVQEPAKGDESGAGSTV